MVTESILTIVTSNQVVIVPPIDSSRFKKRKFMASAGDREESEWIDRIISEGAVPLLEPDNCSNGWATPPGDAFMVRGPEYFTTRVKVPAGDYLLKPLGFDWIKSSVKIGEILNNPNSRVRKVIDNEFPAGDKPFLWAFNLQVPTKDNYSAIAYFTTKEPVVEDSLMDKFLKGDNAFRNSRLKLIANIVKGPWIVRKAVGEQAICVIGRALSCKYCLGENFMEVDIDIGSSMVASAIVHLAFGYISTLTVDLAFLIESQVESELPEKILGAFRFSDLDPASARTIEPSSIVSCDDVQTSLPTRLWKSIGQGFSHILHSGPQEDGFTSDSQHSKVAVDHKDNPTDNKN
ncbi:protein ENHANCED DISEASE RESISTANCE 2 isoform X2 [Cajanus cajan]|uniref:protein ENHANCED DISEASE RESISTANCE 2 isoform X2 n=1 Tax=Cajanus cajan TaxID=3821 RepID=UPI00098D87BF|nr:protein ENHANCED DISEASE RESISTANCE 2 isoform X2 [Cajanus cajan]